MCILPQLRFCLAFACMLMVSCIKAGQEDACQGLEVGARCTFVRPSRANHYTHHAVGICGSGTTRSGSSFEHGCVETDFHHCSFHNEITDCFDPSTCTPGAAKRKAVVSVFDTHREWPGRLRSGKRGVSLMGMDLRVSHLSSFGYDVVFVLPKRELQEFPVPDEAILGMVEVGVRVLFSDWIVPPNISDGVPKEGGCCGQREFMKLFTFGFEEYDAIMVADNDFHLRDPAMLTPLFDCAAEGHVITTRGASSAANAAMMVLPPTKMLRSELVQELTSANVSKYDGWNGAGWGPGVGKFDARVQGFMYWYFYQQYSTNETRWRPVQVEPCVYNLQNNFVDHCKAELCSGEVYGMHKSPDLRRWIRQHCQSDEHLADLVESEESENTTLESEGNNEGMPTLRRQ